MLLQLTIHPCPTARHREQAASIERMLRVGKRKSCTTEEIENELPAIIRRTLSPTELSDVRVKVTRFPDADRIEVTRRACPYITIS